MAEFILVSKGQAIGLLFLLFCSTSHCSILRDDPPIPNEKEMTWLAPRALVYFAYQFPHRANLSSRAVISHSKLTKWLFPEKKAEFDRQSKETIEGHPAKWADVLKTDWNHQHLLTSKKIIDYFLAEPSHRKTEHPGKEICKASQEVKIVQILTEPFLPAEVPVYSCGKVKSGAVTYAHLLLRRDFMAGLKLDNRMEMYKDDYTRSASLAVSYHGQLLNSLYSPLLNMWPNSAAVLQAGTRASSGQIWKNKGTYEEGSGRLQVALLPSFLHSSEDFIKKTKTGKATLWQYKLADNIIPYWGAGMTVQFASWQDDKMADSDVIVNVDTLTRQVPLGKPTVDSLFPNFDTLSIYEPWNSAWNLTDLAPSMVNLRLDVQWEPFTCCSKCCCERKMCGAMETSSRCEQLESFKTRRGFLVLKKVDQIAPVDLSPVLKSFLSTITNPSDLAEKRKLQKELEQMFAFSPYREKGVALYSTLIPLSLRRAIVQDHFERLFLLASNRTQYTGVGLFVDRKSCMNDPQKMDCYELAKCRGMTLLVERNTSNREPEVDQDPCTGITFRRLILVSWKNWFKLEKGVHYKIQLEGVNEKNIIWKIEGRKVTGYRNTVACDKQGTVTRHGHLLFTNNSKLDEELKIEAHVAGKDVVVAILHWQMCVLLGTRPNIFRTPRQAKEAAEMFSVYLGLYFGIGGAIVLLLLGILIVDLMIILRGERTSKVDKKSRR